MKKDIFNEEKSSKLDKQITIQLNPRKLIKFGLIAVMLLVIFSLGRLSCSMAACESNILVDDGPSAAAVVEEVVEEEPEVVVEEVIEEPEEVVEEVVEEFVEEEPEVEEEEDEKIVTTYNKVSLAIDGVLIKWMGTWGRITGLEYTIKNLESGTIEPSYFIMIVEGYGEDLKKQFSVSYTSEQVKSGKTLKDSSAVSGGFAYSEVTAGDLSDVGITLQLYDSSGKLIATASKSADLNE